MNDTEMVLVRTYNPGDLIVREGDLGDTAYIIDTGSVEIFRTVSAKGEERRVVLATLGPGQHFGEMALLDNSVRSASVQAKSSVTLRAYSRDALRHMITASPDVALSLLSRMSEHLRNSNELIIANSLTPSTEADDSPRRGWQERLLPWRTSKAELLTAFQSDAAEIEGMPVPAAAILTIYVLVGFVVTFIAWAGLSTVETIVSTQGRVVTDAPKAVIKATARGTLKDLRVRDGHRVATGDLLAVLDPTVTQADLAAVLGKRAAIMAQMVRLEAELEGRMPERFSPDEEENLLQESLFRNHMEHYQAQRTAREEEIARLEGQLADQAGQKNTLGKQKAIIGEVEDVRQELYDKQFASRLNLLSARLERLNMEREMLSLELEANGLRRSISARKADLDAFESSWRAERKENLANFRQQARQLEEELKKQEWIGRQVEITAPIDGVVMGTSDIAPSALLQEGEPIMTLIPLNGRFAVEADVPAGQVGELRAGLPVSVKLEAFPFQKYGDMTGRLEQISDDILPRDLMDRPNPVYRLRITLGEPGSRLAEAPEFRLISGMNTTADIKVGRRTILSYFLYPVMRWISYSIREP